MYVRPERVVCVCGEAESSEAALDWRCCHINPLSATLRFLCSVDPTWTLNGCSVRKECRPSMGELGVCVLSKRGSHVCVCAGKKNPSCMYFLPGQ